jgi:3-oxoacyl-[acyl-carrier-protein] synthase-3
VLKIKLQIKPKVCCLRYPFGCPGWIEGYCKQMLTSNQAQRCLVIGSETLSRVVDKHDIPIYSDGAGASVIEASDDEQTVIP